MITITEGLAEIKTISRRIEKKRKFVIEHLFLNGQLKDPLESEGGSLFAIKKARQSIKDLENRVVKIRAEISKANANNSITVSGETRTIGDWIVWRREVSKESGRFLDEMRATIAEVRRQAGQKQLTVSDAETTSPHQVTVYVKELELAEEIEHHANILGMLDGQLSLKNATILIDV